MSEREDERRLRAAFTRLREQEVERAPSLAQLLARAEASASRARPIWRRLALPLAGAAALGVAGWLAVRPARHADGDLAQAPARAPGAASARAWEPPIALGSLRSPTDVLLAPPLPSLSARFSDSLIPAPPAAAPAQRRSERSRTSSDRRSPA
jgi:hypothetical protein